METLAHADDASRSNHAPRDPAAPVSLQHEPRITPARIATTARIVFIVLALLAFAFLARAVILPVVLAWVISMTLKAPVRWLRGCRLPTPLAAAIVVGIFVTGIGFGVTYLVRPAMDWAISAPENIPKLKAKFHRVLRPAARLTEAASSVGNLATDVAAIPSQSVEVKDNHVASTVFNWTGSLLAGAGETIALVFLLLASGELFLQKLVRVIPRLRDKKQAVEVCREIQQSISTYLLSVGIVNLGFGASVGLTLHLLGMPNAIMWGGVAMFANFIPYLGPIVGIAAVGLAGLLAFDTLPRALLPAGAYLLLHLIEANAVTPFVLGRRFTLNPVVIFVALIFCAWLWGIIGALLAVPLLVTVKLVCDRVPALALISEFLASQETPDPAAEPKPAPTAHHLGTTADAATRVP